MNDDLDQNLAESLHRRAAGAPTDTMHFGDVRRRVRRRRQRHVAMGVAPALIGVGYLATRPVAEPTQSADSVDSTWSGDATTTQVMPVTVTWPGNVWPYRCLDESAYDAGDGWTYYAVCEQMPEMTAPTTTIPGDYYPTGTMSGPTTSDNGGQPPTNVATTTTDPAGSSFDPNATSTTQVP